MKTQKIMTIIIIIMALILLSGCVTPSGPSHDTLVVTTNFVIYTQEGRTYTLDKNWGGPGPKLIADQIYGYLMELAPGEDSVLLNGLAESWTQNEEETQWTFRLRPGLKFHDNSSVTAVDIEYSMRSTWAAYGNIDNSSDPAFANFMNFSYSSPDSLEFTIDFAWQYSYPEYLYAFGLRYSIWGIIPEGSYETAEQQELFHIKPISCGPYMVEKESDVTANSALLTRFDDWYGWGQTFNASNGKQYTFPSKDKAFKHIKYIPHFVRDHELVLTSGAVDIVADADEEDFDNTGSFQRINQTPGFEAHFCRINSDLYLGLNIQGDWPSFYGGPGNFPLSQTWFRRALSHGINKSNPLIELDPIYKKDTVYPEYILTNYPDITNTDYEYNQYNLLMAQSILDEAGYSALGFSEEPDNRFGWGPYANETTINGTLQTKGRHFKLLTRRYWERNIDIALFLKTQLAQLGIYVDVISSEDYTTSFMYATPGSMYNTSYTTSPDPAFSGPDYDFYVLGAYGRLPSPDNFLHAWSFAEWYNDGFTFSGMFNESFEIASAKIYGGDPGFDINPPDMPSGGYPVPKQLNDDIQYVEGCELAGRIIASELPLIPLAWNPHMYAFNSHVKNVMPQMGWGSFDVAYMYWEE